MKFIFAVAMFWQFLFCQSICAGEVSQEMPLKKARETMEVALKKECQTLSARHLREHPKADKISCESKWEDEETSLREEDSKTGWIFIWSKHPPGGFEFDVSVFVSKNGKSKVKKMSLIFAND